MGLDFDWTTNNDEQEGAVLSTVRATKHSLRSPFIAIVVIAILGLLGWSGYQIVQQRNKSNLYKAAQIYQQLQQQAIRAQNGSLFQSVNAGTPAWLSAQLQPRSWQTSLLDPQILSVEPHIDGLIATTQWRADAAMRQRLVFYTWRNNTLVQAPIPVEYWGDISTIQQSWGRLTVREVDQPWANEIAQFTNQLIKTECDNDCRAQRLPFALTIRSSLSATAAPRQIVIASPRLWALDASGNPAPPFWDALAQELRNQLAPAHIRFAAPALLVERLQRVAIQFMDKFPTVQVEIVALETLPEAPDQLFASVDGAYLLPTVGMITSGLIHDLTDFAATDPQIEDRDFEPRLWQAAQWQKRLWMLPQSATMRLFFYDRAAIEAMGLAALPIDDWDRFDEMLLLARAQKDAERKETILFDVDADLLAAYVNHLHCHNSATDSDKQSDLQQVQAHCLDPIEQSHWVAGLTWYQSAVVDTQTIMDLSGSAPTERENMALQIKSLPIRTVLWTEQPANFEHYQQLHKLGIAPLPGSNGQSVAPMRLHGSVISQQAANPQAVWHWINYLTFERPLAQSRDIPARRSVATAIRFWDTLPGSLRTIMREEFLRARPVLLEEETYLEWQNLAPFLNGDTSANDVAQEIVDPPWFTFIDTTSADKK